SDVEVGANDVLSKRQHRPRREHRTEHQRRRRDKEPAVGRRGAYVLLRDELEGVRERLEQAERSDVIRPEAVLDDRLNLPLEVDLQKRTVQNEKEGETHS